MLREGRHQHIARRAACRPARVSHRLPLLLVLAVMAQLATGCSVGMALSGEQQPDLSVLKVGADRMEIEAQFHQPKSQVPLPDGRTEATYLYEVGNEPSAGRAALNAGMDILTFGVWEVVGTPIEAIQGEEMQVVVVYDAAGKAETFTVTERAGGSAAPKKGPPGGGSRS